MSCLRALLACVWLLLSLTATTAMPAMALDMPCHMEMNGRQTPHHKPDAPATLQTVMPCCSQPVLAASIEPAFLVPPCYERVHLIAGATAPLAGLSSHVEPRPPKIV